MPLNRPLRPAAGAITDRIRNAVLHSARQRLELDCAVLLELHVEAEYLADSRDLIADIDHRYRPATSLQARALLRMSGGLVGALTGGAARTLDLYTNEGADFILLELPDPEFVTVIENTVDLAFSRCLIGDTDEVRDYNQIYARAEGFISYVDRAFAAHGAPYRRITDTWRFEWIGDPKQHELVVQPALQALDDPRLAGARAEFDEALRKRRLGTPKDLEDAVDEAAKSVESVLQVLHDECGVTRSGREAVAQLFGSLRDANVLPTYVANLVSAAAGPRNQMAAHGQGGTVREVPEELADASIAAAATAITFLGHYLP